MATCSNVVQAATDDAAASLWRRKHMPGWGHFAAAQCSTQRRLNRWSRHSLVWWCVWTSCVLIVGDPRWNRWKIHQKSGGQNLFKKVSFWCDVPVICKHFFSCADARENGGWLCGLLTWWPLIALFIHVPICSHKYSNMFSTNISPASLNKTTHLGTCGKLFVIYFEIGIVTEFCPPDGYFFLPSNAMETSCNTSLLFQPNRWKMLRHICHLKGWTKHVMLRKTFHLMRWNVCRILSI